MAKIKHTKNELKSQRDGLQRFERYLPTLQLKKQQLQLEVRRLEASLEKKEQERKQMLNDLKVWISLFSENFEFEKYLQVSKLELQEGNIAGVAIPVLKEVEFTREVPDLFESAPWVDDALRVLEQAIILVAEMLILREQEYFLREELRVTNQRVNLFEKVKIPEAKENIRVIRIFLGDQQTAEVARGKIAKKKSTPVAA